MRVLAPLILAVIIALSPLLSAAGYEAYADENEIKYAYAEESNTAYICKEPDTTTALFSIPKSYCVRVLSESDGWYVVSYAEDAGIYKKVTGYCRAEYLTITYDPPVNTYLYMPVTVTFTAATGGMPALSNIEVTAAYYGNYARGSAYYSYVLYDGSFGYIEGAIDEYPVNEYVVTTVAEPAEKNGKTTLIVALVITGVAAAAIVVLYLTGRKPARKGGKDA